MADRPCCRHFPHRRNGFKIQRWIEKKIKYFILSFGGRSRLLLCA
jgi:hypothetical protein